MVCRNAGNIDSACGLGPDGLLNIFSAGPVVHGPPTWTRFLPNGGLGGPGLHLSLDPRRA